MTASNSPNAFLRRAEPSDAGTVQRISAEAYALAHLAVIGAVPKPATEDHRPRIGRGEVWILEAQGDPRGIIVLEEKPDHLLVYSVAVGPGHQGRGHGAALLSFADRQARASGVQALRLYTNRRMERNVALYRRCGFAHIAERPHPSRPGEVLVDMEKKLLPVT